MMNAMTNEMMNFEQLDKVIGGMFYPPRFTQAVAGQDNMSIIVRQNQLLQDRQVVISSRKP